MFAPFSPFHAVWALVDFHAACKVSSAASLSELIEVRVLRGIMSAIIAFAYGGIVVYMYRQMVRSFDMTVRRQSA